MTRDTHSQAMHRGADGGPLDADDILIDDAGAYYAGLNVEAALQEIGAGGIGGGGGGVALEPPEIPTGTIDGANDTFTLSTTPTGAIILVKNGLIQREGSGNDYTIVADTITYEAGNIPQVGDSHIAYLTAAGATAIDILDEGGSLTATPMSIDFVGAGVTATTSGDDVTVTIPGGGSGGVTDVYGDGSDGDVVINSGTFSVSVGGSALITNNVLLRDAYFHDLELNGGDLITGGFKVFVSGTLTMTSGVIRYGGNAGGNGGNGTAGAGGAAGAQGSNAASGSIPGSVLGAGGAVGGFNANGANPGATQASIMGLGTAPNGVAGGDSGQGQTGGIGNTAVAGTNTSTERPFHFLNAVTFRASTAALFTMTNYTGQSVGSGSGAGSPASGGGGSGGGGASGATIVVCANTITGTTDIRAKGAAGGNGGNGGGTNAGGGGAGNGGNGGFICLVYSDQAGWSGTLDVTGGAGGTGGTGIGTGTNGTNGSTGRTGKALSFQVTA